MYGIADRFDRLAGDFLARVHAVPADRWDRPSPCAGWTARDVVTHVINGHRGIIAAVHGIAPRPSYGVGLSDMAGAPAAGPDADLAAAYAEARAGLRDILTDPHLAATPLPFTPIGPVPVEQAADVVGALELLVHTWDLARAVGGDETLDREAVIRTHERLRPHYAALQATEAFGAQVAPPPGAGPQTAFLCFTGRRP
ncbi:TIGR03086 family protein [Planobispora rosea]|uniref:TIGR03086 family protein n=1 Tax=Planobispora rosea TaxID=35762 RepID=A0A8J3S8D1_PLARO|nr:TIGR03086 family metal-binding protein [Planobispora rosea]GGS98200.1 TIGR03086 family protein [Planobispora rosea]GIH87912.1 TIGR03086 family protein [Planobispora rosea]